MPSRLPPDRSEPRTLSAWEPLAAGSRPGKATLAAVPPSENIPLTGMAPSLPEPLPSRARVPPEAAPRLLAAGERIGDFEIVDVLGRGAFGVVYLARQLSLDRQVALKISAARGDEGRTMGQLEHESIVQVFSETLDSQRRQRLLCMQYVPGTTLADALQELRRRQIAAPRGSDLLDAVDHLTRRPAPLDPAALRDRQQLQEADWVETVCWVGSRLADALGHAHRHGVLHRDIKPANTLLTQYGRPLLVDFNLAFRPLDTEAAADLFGGTLAYMAPEHLDACNPATSVDRDVVDARADMYSLGVVLWEMAAGRLPFSTAPPGQSQPSVLRAMAEQRRQGPPPLPAEFPLSLRHCVRKCLQPEPDQRYQDAAELAAALEGCRQLRQAQNRIPARDRFLRELRRHPFFWLVAFCLLANLASSAVNISYNHTQIIAHLSDSQQRTFAVLLVAYNLPVYLLGIGVGYRILLPVLRGWRVACGKRPIEDGIDRARRMALRLPVLAAALSMLGWFPGSLLFPLGLHVWDGPMTAHVFAHFLIDFAICGLIATTYSFLLLQCLVLCVFYPRLWSDTSSFRATARRELQPIGWRLRLFQILAGLIPLIGAILLLGVGPQELTPQEYAGFRLLVTGLIGLGIVGFHMSVFITRRVTHLLTILAGAAEAADEG